MRRQDGKVVTAPEYLDECFAGEWDTYFNAPADPVYTTVEFIKAYASGMRMRNRLEPYHRCLAE